MLMIDEIEGMAEVQFRQMLEEMPEAELRRLAADDRALGALIPPLLTKREARAVLDALLSRPVPAAKPKKKRVAKKRTVTPAEAVAPSMPDAPMSETAPAPVSEPAEIMVPSAPAVPMVQIAESPISEAPEDISAPVAEPITQPDGEPLAPASEDRPSLWTRFKRWLRSKAGP